MDVLLLLLLMRFGLSYGTMNSYHFTQFTSPCTMSNFIYYDITDVSVGKCAHLCYENTIGKCGRLVWDPNTRTCMLHSIRNDKPSVSISTKNTWLTYSKFVKECDIAGYDYDLETNTCLKYHVTGTGVTWKEARTRCQQDGGHLISIQTKAKWDFVTNYLFNCVGNVWIGIKGRKWTTGDDFVNIFGVNDLLNSYDSDFTYDTESDCGVYHKWTTPIQDESCNIRTKTGFLCEIIIP